MKKILIGIAVAILCLGNVSAQDFQIKKSPIETENIVRALNSLGYHFFSFDLSGLNDGIYGITLYMQEFNGKELLQPVTLTSYTNKSISKYGTTYFDKLDYNIIPINDSTIQINYNVNNGMSGYKVIKKCGIKTNMSDNPIYFYNSRPFSLSNIKLDQNIPLVMYGSNWYDSKNGFFRFCGEKELNPDMSSEMLKMLPHYYIFGIYVKKIN